MSEPEFWLRGPIPEVAPLLQPVVHALLQAREDVERATGSLADEELWVRPGGAASAGFHLKHLAGSIDRLLTYARGESLTEEQLAFLRAEQEAEDGLRTPSALDALVAAAIERAIEQVRATPESGLLEPRRVGRAELPSTVLGLLFHAAEHTTRHAGQLITTAAVVRGLALREPA